MKDLAGLAGPAGLAGRAGGEMPEIFCSELARSAGPAGLAGKAGGEMLGIFFQGWQGWQGLQGWLRACLDTSSNIQFSVFGPSQHQQTSPGPTQLSLGQGSSGDILYLFL